MLVRLDTGDGVKSKILQCAKSRRLTQAMITGLCRGFLEYVSQFTKAYTRIAKLEQELDSGSQCGNTARITVVNKVFG